MAIINAQNRLEELTQTQISKPPKQIRFAAELTDKPKDKGFAVSVREGRVRARLEIQALTISPSARLILIGPNGAGKSTLLNVLAGRLKLDSGEIRWGRNLRIGLLEQDARFADPRQSARELYERTAGREAIPLARLGLLPPQAMDRPVASLSVGPQRRLALAPILARPPELLLLDEPSNHLSLNLVEDLEAALQTAPGAVVLASHDRWLRRPWTGETLELIDGRPVNRPRIDPTGR